MRAALSRSGAEGRATAAAEIHSPLHSPAMLIPVVMRDCGGFGAVSKTVDGRKVVRGFESLPLR
jgi:hypothetical protein